MADLTFDIFSNNAPTIEIAKLVAAFISSQFYLKPYIDYLLAVPLPKNAQGCRIIDPMWQDQIRETVQCIFSNPVLVLKISSANYADETRYPANYSFHIGTNGTRGAFPDSSRYQEVETLFQPPPTETLKLTPALIVAYCLCTGDANRHFGLNKLESDKLTNSYSSYIHDDVLTQSWNPVLASFLFLLKLITHITTFRNSEDAFLPMIDFTWNEIATRLGGLKTMTIYDQRFLGNIEKIIDVIKANGSHRLFTYVQQIQDFVAQELRTLDSHFSRVLSNYCK